MQLIEEARTLRLADAVLQPAQDVLLYSTKKLLYKSISTGKVATTRESREAQEEGEAREPRPPMHLLR